MKLKDYRKKLEESTPQELDSMHRDLVDELFRLRFQLATGHLEDSSKIRQLRKNIARIETTRQEKKDESFWKKRGLVKT